MNLSELTPRLTSHFTKTVLAKGFDPQDVILAIRNPAEVYPSGSHPGQWRVTGRGLCIVGKPEGNEFVLITIYLDRVVTACRPDQLATAEGRRFAQYGRGA